MGFTIINSSTFMSDDYICCRSLFQELEKKVNQTAPFRNLKSMLQKKNEQIKDLRKRLCKWVSQ